MNSVVIIILICLLPVLFVAGYFLGKTKKEEPAKSKRIEEYSFYPFITNEQGRVEFSQSLFNEAVTYLIKNKNAFASRQLIIIGEQNIVRDILPTPELNNYLILYNRYNGQELLLEQDRFMENYKRIVTLFGKSFRNTGIEILLHNLVNPVKSVIAIENGEVTGRQIENGTTNLLLDLKTRKQQNQDKLNYELKIGSRLFKCTTIPIFRRDYGLVGAICINVDANFIRHEVTGRKDKLEAFIENIIKTDFLLNENILSKEEYDAAMAGKKHFADNTFRFNATQARSSRLMAIFFSDVVGYSSMMGKDEKEGLRILDQNRRIHQEHMEKLNGTLLKEIGDGTLAGFNSVLDAVKCGIEIQKQVKKAGQYQLRIGIHLGEVITEHNDVFGDGVNIASRIESVAMPGIVAMSEAVYNNVKNKIEEEIVFNGEKQLKNIADPVKIFQVNIPGA